MRNRIVTTVVVLLLAACGATTPAATHHRADRTPPVADPTLVRTIDGVVGVTTGTDDVQWSVDGAVVAADGSAIFSRPADGELARHDPASGAVTERWPIPTGLAPVLVEPRGARVLLSDRPIGYDSERGARPVTRLQLRTDGGATAASDLQLAGDVEPEAFATVAYDPTGVFVLDHRGDHYRVQRLDLVTGEHTDVSDRDKQPGEDMRGRPVHGVLDAHHTMLATLYVNPQDTADPAFVHVLNLGGFTSCVELPAAFAVGPPRSQSIEITDRDVIVVRAPQADLAARFDLRALERDDHPTVTVTGGAGIAADAPYRSVPGFLAVVGRT